MKSGWRNAFIGLAAMAVAACSAGTVTGTVLLPSGTAYTNTIRFRPTSTPTADAGVLVPTTDTLVTPNATNGTFSVSLAAGRYDVGLLGTRGFSIEVPAGSATNAIDDLVYYGAASWNTLKLNPTTLEPYWPEGFWLANSNAINALVTGEWSASAAATMLSAASNAVSTFDSGMIVFATNNSMLYIHDGVTAGGIAVVGGSSATVATPTFDPNGGTFATSVEVTIACATGGATIYYTTNGTTPDTNSTVYSTPFTLTSTTTVKAIGVLEWYTDSEVASATFTKTYPVYYGLSALTTLGESGVTNLTATAKSSATGSYTYGAGTGYMYFASVAAWSTPTRFTISGLDVSLEEADPYDNTFGTLYYAPVTIGGVSYRLFRSYNAIGGGYTLVVQ